MTTKNSRKMATGLAMAALVLVLAPAASAQYVTIASEDFDSYTAGTPIGGLSGGSGWFNDWWGGFTGDAAIVTSPGFGGTPNKLSTNRTDDGAYRVLDQAGLGKLLDPTNLVFGKDDTTFWFQFDMQRTGDDLYGGFSLNWQFVGGEQIFIGSPFNTFEMGLERVGSGTPITVAGTSPDTLYNVVIRVDHLVGDDRVRMWLNPGTPFPTTAADIDTLVADMKWNEIRFQSGQGVITGYDFDNLVISADDTTPVLAVTNLVAGQMADVSVTNCDPGNTVIIAYSLTGAGPTPTPVGDVALSQPIVQLPPQVADPSGSVSIMQTIPPAGSGRPVWIQAAELLPGGGGVLSNALAETIL